MAATAGMTTRGQLDAELDHLESMLPVWREKLRVEAQFWPQFNTLSEEILMRADPADRDHARQRIDAMLAECRAQSRKGTSFGA